MIWYSLKNNKPKNYREYSYVVTDGNGRAWIAEWDNDNGEFVNYCDDSFYTSLVRFWAELDELPVLING